MHTFSTTVVGARSCEDGILSYLERHGPDCFVLSMVQVGCDEHFVFSRLSDSDDDNTHLFLIDPIAPLIRHRHFPIRVRGSLPVFCKM